MNAWREHITLILLILVGASCSKQVGPIDNHAEPAFYFKGLVGSDSVEIIAGQNGYFMETHCTPSDSFPRLYQSHLRRLDCPNCGPRLDLEWINLDHYPGISPDTALEPGYIIVSGIPIFPVNPRKKSFYPQFSPSFGMGNVQSIEWDFGDGSSSTEINPVHEFAPGGPDVINVRCDVEYLNGCSQNIEIPVNLTNLEQPNTLMMHTGGGNGVHFELLNYPFDLVEWKFGDGQTASGHSVDHVYNSNGVYQVEVIVKDPSGSTILSVHRSKIQLGLGTGCGASFTYHSEPIQNLQLRFGQIRYLNAQNEEYSTQGLSFQSAYIELLDHQYYKKNALGQDVYICEFKADLWLYKTGPGLDSIPFKGSMFLGVAHD